MSRTPGLLAMGAGLLAAALLFGVPLLLVPGLALLAVVAAAEISVRVWARGAALEREPRSVTALEGATLHLATHVQRGRTRLRIGEVSLLEGGRPKPLRWFDGDDLGFTIRAERRGRQRVPATVLSFHDPFGVAARSLRSQPTELLVLPRIEQVGSSAVARLRSGAETSSIAADGVGEADGVAPAGPGVAAGRIHWPTVARTGVLVQRRMTAESDRSPLVVLDTRHPPGPREIDMAVRAAGSLAVALARSGGCRLLLCDEGTAHVLDRRLAGWPKVHVRLALIGAGHSLAWRVVAAAPIVVWVTVGGEPAPRAEEGRVPEFVVAPAAAGRPPLFTVAGCGVFDAREQPIVGAP
ncbi:MAG TPA: DUF58 domain-containing protein [Solirubrobacteraceae bacterium]|nr:DUF58 domain-containing protein [Solirubrobacteraceae bacterium]